MHGSLCEKRVIVIVIGLHSGTVLGVVENWLKRVRMFQIELEHKIFKVFIAWSEKKNMYYPITPN